MKKIIFLFSFLSVTSLCCAQKSAIIKDVTIDFDVIENDINGMRFHIKFEVSNMKDEKGWLCIYFYNKNEEALTASNSIKNYKTTDNHVAVWGRYTPPHEGTAYNDYTLFMPYEALCYGPSRADLRSGNIAARALAGVLKNVHIIYKVCIEDGDQRVLDYQYGDISYSDWRSSCNTVCSLCYGRGGQYSYGGYYNVCYSCGGTGRCSICGGTGYTGKETVYNTTISTASQYCNTANNYKQKEDDFNAFRYWKLSAERGFAEGQANLGYAYLTGTGVDKNSSIGVVWLQKAVEKNNNLGIMYLTMCYYYGDGVSKDLPKARMLYNQITSNDRQKLIAKDETLRYMFLLLDSNL